MYRKIEVQFWTDPKIKAIGGAARYLMLYLITNPHTHVSGIYYLPKAFVAHETGIELSELDTLYDTLSGAGLAKFSPDTDDVVWVVNMFRHQGPGPKLYRSAAKHLDTLHRCSLTEAFCLAYPEVQEYRDG